VIPAELQERRQWVVWRSGLRDGDPTKVPYRVDGRGRASSTNATTWGSFGDARLVASTGELMGSASSSALTIRIAAST